MGHRLSLGLVLRGAAVAALFDACRQLCTALPAGPGTKATALPGCPTHVHMLLLLRVDVLPVPAGERGEGSSSGATWE
jgi:hypothetical protein